MKRNRRKAAVLVGLVVLVLAGWAVWHSLPGKQQLFPEVGAETLQQVLGLPEGKAASQLSYIQVATMEEYRQFPPARQEVAALAVDYRAAAPEADISLKHDAELQGEVLEWTNAEGWVEWEVTVPEDGRYDLRIHYLPLEGSFSPIVRGVQIDGEYPFLEAEQIRLNRSWQDSEYPYARNAIGNEIRPVQEQLFAWRNERAVNYAVSSEPLQWALTAGTHTIRLVGIQEPVAIYGLALTPPQQVPDYQEYLVRHSATATPNEDWYAIYEAERYASKSAISIRSLSVNEPYVSPDPKGRVVYNAIGGNYWQNAGERLEWEVEVPQDGYYAIDLKFFQGYNGDASVYRTITINDEVPFREMLHYRFAPNSALDIGTLADEEGNPYRFYLHEGKNRLAMAVNSSLMRPAIEGLHQFNEKLSAIERNVRVISGNYGYGSDQNLDQARVWEMRKYDPQIEAKLQGLIDELAAIRDYVQARNQSVTDASSALSAAINRLEYLLEDVDGIPNQVKLFGDIKASINTWIKPLENQPLQLDYIVVRAPEASPKLKVPGTLKKLQYTVTNFLRTFVQKYDAAELNDDEALTIWVQRGLDYVDLLQLLIEQDFTPSTGIKVNVNLIPNQNVLLMGNAAGDQPDVALGVGMEVPVDYAMRNASQDLSKFPGFEEVMARFNPGIMRSYAYNEGVYGLPETQTYSMMFYRTDIFSQLGIEPPDTWDDVLGILPTLQENGMSFMYPKPDFMLPYYQHGAEFYTENGLEPQLTESLGLAAFKQWTDWFNKYDLPKDVPAFFNHFRYGDMPIGVSDITMYVQLMVAAPELSGHWKMLPLPGIRQADGTVMRWSAQEATSAIMMQKSERQEDAWKFLEWWTSDRVQSQYGLDIESFAGIEYRWHTANTAALQTLLWPREELAALNEQGQWVKNLPYVPGYYFLPREMDFAWNDTVLGGKPPREALENAQISLLREMLRKQQEFGISRDEIRGE